jgi:hypothetical protein
MLDESEVETIPDARKVESDLSSKEEAAQKPIERKASQQIEQPKKAESKTMFDKFMPAHLKATPGPTEYVFPLGKFKGLALSQIKESQLVDYINWIKENAAKEKKELKGAILEAVIRSEEYLSKLPSVEEIVPQVELVQSEELPF